MSSSQRKRAQTEYLIRLPWLLVWAGVIICASLTLWLGLAGVSYPYQLDYGEGIVLWFAQQLLHGHSIYKGLTGFPYASSNYPPLSMLLAALLMPILGEGYAAGRLLNLSAGFVVSTLIYRIVAAETRDRRTGFLAALFFFGAPYVYHWIPLFRADLLGLCFAFAGIYVVWKAQRLRNSTRSALLHLAAAILFFTLALYTKHTLFAAPAATFASLWATNRRRAALAFGTLLGTMGGVLYLVLDAITHGGFTFGLLTSNATVFMPDQLIRLLENFAATFPVLLALAGIGFAKRVQNKTTSVLDWYLITSLGALVMAGRTGAWENYFFETIASSTVLAGMALARLLPARATASSFPSTLPFASFRVALPILLFVQLALMWQDPRIAHDLMVQGLPANRELALLLRSTPGTIISEDLGALATSGKEVAYYTFQYSSLARSGKWDQSWELNGLRDGAFPLVILERGTREDVDHYMRFTREFVSSLDRYYANVQSIGKYEVYRPAPLDHLQRVSFGQSIALVGWSVVPHSFSQPATAQLTIVWQAERSMEQHFTAFVHLSDEHGGKVTQEDKEPRAGRYPTTRWALGEMVREVYVLRLPPDTPPGKYYVRVGWYDSETLDRLVVPGSQDDSVLLTTLEIPPSK